ncbi:MAG: queuosine precursor transporter [Chloroflexi bacterium]|nr:queuosine precursor transporter [Chloroflexota bacterium]
MSGLFLLLASLFVTLLVASNIIAVKVTAVAGLVLPAAIAVFPVTYILGDVLTEVYGFRVARRVIWLGFVCNLVAVAAFWVGGLLPAFAEWKDQGAYEAILGRTPRILLASFLGYLAGELSNSQVLARLKVLTRGRWLWSRTISSTIVGQGFDSALFITVAFAGTVVAQTGGDVLRLVVTQWGVKVAYEALMTPVLYPVVAYVKRREGVDTYDRDISFNPLRAFR